MQPVFSNLISNDIIKDEGYYFVISGIGNKLYKISVDSLEIKDVCEIKVKRDQDYLIYMSGTIHGSEVYYAPHTAKSIGVFNIHNNSMRYIDFDNLKTDKSLGIVSGRYTYSFAHDDSIYFLGFSIPGIMKLNLKNNEISFISIPDDVQENYNGQGYFSQGWIKTGEDGFLLPMGCECKFFSLNTKSTDAELVIPIFAKSLNGIGGVSVDSKGIVWVTSRNTKTNMLVSWDMKKDQYIIYPLEGSICEYGTYYAPIITEDYIYVFPESKDHVYRLPQGSSEVEIVRELEELIDNKMRSLYFGTGISGLKRIDDKVIFFTCHDYAFNEYDLLKGTGKKRYINIGNDSEQTYYNMIMSKGFIKEPELMLVDFIKMVDKGE